MRPRDCRGDPRTGTSGKWITYHRRPRYAPFMPALAALAPPPTDPAAILDDVFGYPAFRGAQEEIIDHVIGGGDARVLMPTGGDKSLCYQVPAIARHAGGRGVALVV